MNMRSPNYSLFDPAKLTPTEDVDQGRVEDLETEILRAGVWTTPISIHRNALFVMDGHHRLEVARRLKCHLVPVILLDYDSVAVTAWRSGETITPHSIVAMARSGGRFPCKTTRHLFETPPPLCAIPLMELIYPRVTGYSSITERRQASI